MKVTINWTDHNYHTYDFEIVQELPQIGSVIDKPGDIRQTVDGITNVTSKAARSDFGDGGYYEFYIIYYRDQFYIVDDDELFYDETFELIEGGTSFKPVAIWIPFDEEELS